MTMKKYFGIDLGTTYSCIAYIDENDKPVVLKNSEGDLTTPSVVFFESPDSIIVGAPAKESAKMDPSLVVDFAKNSMGVENTTWNRNGVDYSPEEVSSYVLKKIVNDAVETLRSENKLGPDETINDVVITCPAYFGINEREATKRAGEIAGLNVMDIINEPTAAAISYGVTEADANKVVMVYDLGGGTFDVTIIKIEPGSIRVVCTGGDHHLGGKLWDDRLVSYLADQWCAANDSEEDITADAETAYDLKFNAERAKKLLTSKEKTPVSVSHQGERARVELTREKFNELTADLLENTIMLTRQTLDEAEKKGVKFSDITDILLVGGSSKMPQVQNRVRQEFQGPEIKIFDPDESVAKGAAIYAVNQNNMQKLIQMVAEGKGVSEEKAKEIVKEASRTGNKMLLGEAVQAEAAASGISIGQAISIVNVTSRSFGIVALDNGKETLFNLIKKNDELPADVSQQFYTIKENQATVLLRVFESLSSEEKLDPEMGKLLGTATLEMPSGMPQGSPIEVTFRLNDSGMLELYARELSQNRTVETKFDVKGAISKEEVEAAKKRNQNSTIE